MTSAIRVNIIKPDKLDEAAMMAVFANLARDTEKGILKDFEDTTETWKHNVKFAHGSGFSAQYARAFTETDDEIYRYVNDGTPPHDIPKTGTTFMRFQSGGKGSYRPKTKPGRFGSRPGGPSGPTVVAFKVHHPGTEARKFDELLAKRWEGLLRKAANDAMRDAALASQYAIAET